MKLCTSALIRLLSIVLGGALAACTLRPPQSAEEHMVDSLTLPGNLTRGVVAAPFCLHLRYSNAFYVGYSDSRTETWVTDGSCASKGARRALESVRVSWWYDWDDTQSNRQCLNADGCRINEQNAIMGRNIRCASAQAHEGNQTAFVSTDHAVCH
jgi:hypothetical protein